MAELLVKTYMGVKLTKKDVAAVKVTVGQIVRDAANRYTSVPVPTIWELMEALFDDWVNPALEAHEQYAKNMTEAACWLCLSAYWLDSSVDDAPQSVKRALESLTATVEMSVSQTPARTEPKGETSPTPLKPKTTKVPQYNARDMVQPTGKPRKGEIGAEKELERTAASFREPRVIQPRCKGCKEFVKFCTCEESEKDHSSNDEEQEEEQEEDDHIVTGPAGNGAGAEGRTAPTVCAPPRSHLAFRKAAVMSDSTQWLTALQGGAPLDDLVLQLTKMYVRCPELYTEFGQKKTNEAAIEQIEDLMRGAWELAHEPGDVVEILRVNLGMSLVQATQGSTAAKAYKASHFKDEVNDKERRALKAAKTAGKDEADTKGPARSQQRGQARLTDTEKKMSYQTLPKIAESVWTKMTPAERTASNKARAEYKASFDK